MACPDQLPPPPRTDERSHVSDSFMGQHYRYYRTCSRCPQCGQDPFLSTCSRCQSCVRFDTVGEENPLDDEPVGICSECDQGYCVCSAI